MTPLCLARSNKFISVEFYGPYWAGRKWGGPLSIGSGCSGFRGDISETVFYSVSKVRPQRAGVQVVILEPGAARTSKNCGFGGDLGAL